jgi:hypothetical protein
MNDERMAFNWWLAFSKLSKTLRSTPNEYLSLNTSSNRVTFKIHISSKLENYVTVIAYFIFHPKIIDIISPRPYKHLYAVMLHRFVLHIFVENIPVFIEFPYILFVKLETRIGAACCCEWVIHWRQVSRWRFDQSLRDRVGIV